MVVSLELFKKHTRTESLDFDDDLKVKYLEAAECAVIDYVGRTIDELCDMGGGTIPAAVEQAIIMLAAHFYNQREAVSAVTLTAAPYAVEFLLDKYRSLV